MSAVGGMLKSMNSELDRKIGEIRMPFLCIIEGPNDSGKSVLAQQYTYGALNSGCRVLYITTEAGVKSLIRNMEQISLDIKHFFLTGKLMIFELHVKSLKWNHELSSRFLELLLKTIRKRFERDVYVIDSLTYLVTHAEERDILNFFTEVRNIVDDEAKSIIITIHPYAFNQDLLIRMRSICDVHFTLTIKEIGERIVKILQVPKLKGAVKPSSIILSFDVDPAFGIKVLPFSQARA
ncbi:MAG: flagellar accessory protein FlaH [Aigarchaeota archaeon]|nr:flagellar accessory protein FlaH [Aigarchaeota archaeon]MDW8021923.1 ATPase domain-containing protein [Nitrososphaerota archaeon]